MDISALTGSTTQTQASRDGASLAADFETFLTLLTSQLQNQDPLDPMDSSEFTNQLVQFSSVEQQIRANQNLENLAGILTAQQVSQSVGYLGKEATVIGDLGILENNGSVTWEYELGTSADDVRLQILNERGVLIQEAEASGDLGRQEFIWDGMNQFGDFQQPGTYQLRVVATNEDSPVSATIFTRDLVRQIDTTGAQSTLFVGGNEVPLSAVLALREPTK